MSGEWIEAANDDEACSAALAMCDAATPTIEVWRRATRLAVLPCHNDA